MSRLAVLLLAAAVLGCQSVERHLLAKPGSNEIIRVASGDRYYFSLEEDLSTGASWRYTCDDPDVEVTLDHKPGKAAVRLRVHRGYDGPSTIRFVCKKDGAKRADREFSIVLFRRLGDVAFWE